MSDMALLRIGILIAGIILLACIFFFGRPKKASQGKRRLEPGAAAQAPVEPELQPLPAEAAGEAVTQPELGLADSAENELGKRQVSDFDKIVSLYVAARAGSLLRGEDIVVAAEKTGLVFGHMNVFHRLVEHHPEQGPIFSMANILKPGSFDMNALRELETPAIAFFLTLPAPIPALEAWDIMLPNAQRIAELLDGIVLDDSRNALGRQRIMHIREDLRAYDRQHEVQVTGKRW